MFSYRLRNLFITLFLMLYCVNKAQWSLVNIGTTNNVYAVDYFDVSNIFMVGDDGLIKSTNGGASWTTYPLLDNFNNPIPLTLFYDIHFFDPNNGVATGFVTTGNSETVFRTSNGGLNWSIASVNNAGNWPRMLNDFGFYNLSSGLAVGTNGRIIRTTNSGSTWSSIFSGTTNELKGVSFGSTSLGVIVGDQTILRTTNGGTSWTLYNTPGYNLNNVHMVNTSLGYAIGNGILKTTNGGITWNPINSLSGKDVYALNADSAFICNTGVYKTSNFGGFWGAQASVSSGNYNDLDFLNLTNGFVVGDNGKVYRTFSGGEPLPQTDASVYVVEPYSQTLCPGITPVKVKLKNYGVNAISSATLNWSVNNIYQGSVSWTGNLISDSITPYIQVGTYNFNYTSQKVKVWVSNPNNNIDQFIGNDTSSTLYQTLRLNGNYTIGGVNPDFPTFTAAINAINNYGICGNVVFNVRNGTYTETLTINSYSSAISTSSIIFQSQLSDSSLVILNTSGGTTILLNGAKKITFQKMTISSGAGIVVELKNGADETRIRNCIIKGDVTSAYPSIGNSGTISHTIVIENNDIQNGLYGVSLTGTVSNYGRGFKVYNNVFSGQSSKGIYVAYSDSVIINKNLITSSITTAFEGINVSNSKGAYKISNNKILTSIGSGILVYFCNNPTGIYGKIHNNMVRTGYTGGNLGTALVIQSTYNLEAIHNTLYCLGSSGINTALALNYPDTNNYVNLKLVNNILIANGGGVPIRISNTNFNVQQSYYRKIFEAIGPNCYFNKSSNFMLLPSITCTNLYDWKNNIKDDTLSFILDPQLISSNDLHLYLNGNNYGLESAGIPWPGLISDIDNDSRSGNTDIGADEVIKPALDVQLLSMSDTSRVCSGNNSLLFNVVNRGYSNLNSFVVNWKINNVIQTPYNWSGSLASGNTSAYFPIGLYNFAPGNYTISAWVSSPNNGIDGIAINDSLKKVITAANGLIGNFVIGNSPSNYLTITDAVNDLVLKGICGPVIFNIKSGNYNEQIVIPPIAGSSLYNTITFRSQSADSTSVDWNYSASSSANFVLKLNGVDNFRLERIKIRSLSNTYNTAVDVQLGCNNLIMEGNQFVGKSNGSGTIVNFGSATDNDVIIKGNYFYSGLTALLMQATLSTYESRNQIINNYFFNNRFKSIDVSFQSNMIINNNTVFCDTVCIGSSCGIAIQWTKLPTRITNNNINVKMQSGISWDNHVGGIYTRALIFNNMIHNNGAQAYGALVTTGTVYFEDVFHNSTLIENTSYPNNSAASINGPNSRIHNNMFSNLGTGIAFTPFSKTYPISCNNNVFESSGTYLIAGSGSFTNLATWQAASSWDQNSFQGSPGYISPSNLHITPSSIANNNGTGLFISTVNKDIDGQLRLNIPDIGADELSGPPVVNLGNDTILCSGQSISAGNPGSSYLWNTGSMAQSIPVYTTGTYWVKVTNILGFSSDTINLTINPSPTITMYGNTTICNGGSTSLTASGASSYSWNTTALTPSIIVSPSITTVYSVIGTNSFNCQNTKSISVTVTANPTLSIVISNTSICSGQTSSITIGGAMNYTFDPGGSNNPTQTVSPAVTTTYSITGTNSLNCQDTKTISVVVNANPTVTIVSSNSMLCVGQSATLNANGAATYSWNTNSTSPFISVSPSVNTNYSVIGTDLYGCNNSSSFSQSVSICTSLENLFSNRADALFIFPNPSTGEIKISSSVNINLKIESELGAIITTLLLNESNNYQCNLSNLSNGIYFITGFSNNVLIKQKLIIIR